jgi:hypothetical protein
LMLMHMDVVAADLKTRAAGRGAALADALI